ncbi:MAG: SCO family protein [Gammaproteobacteria bacterium]|nr:SCO family protein [Gammaproteobacteria bacterium]
MASRRRGRAIAGLQLATAVALAALSLAACAPPPPFNATEVKGIDYGRGIGIPDTEGRVRRLEDFKGEVTLVFFGFTRCPDVCPTTLLRLRQARAALGPDAGKLRVLLVSVDPERDTPAVLGAYVKNFDPSFVGLRPEPAQLEAVVKAFHAIAVKVPLGDGGDYTIDHSATLYVYDRANRMRLIAQPDLPVTKLADDLRRLARE